ncbi:MAG TPA: O-antigen ligase family protein [Patescibacteria group bacterium]|nr:O-antigen ligase family protein [Patescibacteria group bacterium]
MRKLIVFFFHLLVLFVPLFFLTANDELFEFNKIILTYVLTSLIVAMWIIRTIVDNRFYFRRTPFDLPIALFYVSQLISTVFSIHPHTSVFGYYSRFNGGLLSISAYILLFYAFINNLNKKDIFQLVNTFLFAGALSAGYAFLEHFGHSPSCFFITGNFDATCWIQDVKTRVFGTFGQPNWLAAYLIMLIPLAVSRVFLVFEKKKVLFLKIWTPLLLALFTSTLLFTQSRSGLLGLAIGGVVFVVVALAGKRGLPTGSLLRQWLVSLGVVVGIVALLMLMFGTPYTPSAANLFKSLQEKAPSDSVPAAVPSAPVQPSGTQLEVGGTESGAIRKIVWKGAIAVWKRYPIFGSGVETFAYSYYKDRPMEHNNVSEWDFLYNKAHNEFLNYLATTGAVGLTAYLLMIAWVYWWGIKHAHTAPLETAAWLSAYTALHVSNFFGFSTVVVSTLFYLIPGFIFLIDDVEVADDKKSRKNPSLSAWSVIAACVVSLISLYAMSVFMNMWRSDAKYAQAKQLEGAGQGVEALQALQEAVRISPTSEAVFDEELAHVASQLSTSAFQQNESTTAAQLGELAIRSSDTMLKKNPVHLNFYKSRARVLITLSTIAPDLFKESLAVLTAAQELAPTDAKLVYNRALIMEQLGDRDAALMLMKRAIQMKPNYTGAKDQLDRMEQKTATQR